MKQLTDFDIEHMANGEFTPDDRTARDVRHGLRLKTTPPPTGGEPDRATRKIDLHNHTIEQAWEKLVTLVNSGARRAVVITGASGILKTEFQKWMCESIISHRIISFAPLNNGSFEIKIKSHLRAAQGDLC